MMETQKAHKSEPENARILKLQSLKPQNLDFYHSNAMFLETLTFGTLEF